VRDAPERGREGEPAGQTEPEREGRTPSATPSIGPPFGGSFFFYSHNEKTTFSSQTAQVRSAFSYHGISLEITDRVVRLSYSP